MTTYYVKGATGNNANSGVDWANAVQTVAGALAKATPTLIYCDASETFASGTAITWTLPATNVAIISVASGTTTWAAGAGETTGTGTVAFAINGNTAGSSLYCYGMVLKSSTGASSSNVIQIADASNLLLNARFDSCTFGLLGNGSVYLGLGASSVSGAKSNNLEFYNCTVNGPNTTTGAMIRMGESNVKFENLTIGFSGASKQTSLFGAVGVTTNSSTLSVSDSDLNTFNAASSAIVDATNIASNRITLKNLKLSTNTTVKKNTFPFGHGSITAINCDSADTINSFEYYDRCGTIVENATNYYTSGGASFNSVPVSWQVVTTSVCDEHNPFVMPTLHRWNTSTSSTTFNVQSIIDSATKLTDAELWLDVGYPSSASFPTGSIATDRTATPITAAGTNQADGTNGSWTTSGFANTTEQYASVTVTPAEVGLVEGTVRAAKASATFYIDPILRVAVP